MDKWFQNAHATALHGRELADEEYWFLVGAFCEAKMPDSYSDPFFLQTTYLTQKVPLFCSFVKLELRISKTYWIRQNLVQNRTEVVQNLKNKLRIRLWLSWCF